MNMPYQQPMMNYTPNYGTYQYNPMASYQRYQQPEPTQGISGRVVQAVETINPNEVPMDGSVAFFPKQDLTEIYAKSWNADGTIRTLTFKPVLNDKTDVLSGDTEKLEFDLSEKAVSEFEKGIENVDTSEMGEVVDMIKDLAEAEYHSIISKAMKKADEEEEEYDKELLRSLKAEYGEESGRRYYDQYRYANGRFAPKGRGTRRGYEEPPYYHMPVNYNDMEYMRDMDKNQGKMYYSEPIAPHVSESNYDRAKRHYTETKEMHKGASTEDKEHKMKALDMYIRELSGDISELLNDMTPDERNLFRTKMSNLASKL